MTRSKQRRRHHRRRQRRTHSVRLRGARPGPTVGLALIVRNEQDTLPALLESIEGAFDQVVLLDTGSADDTVGVFRRWCDRIGQAHVVDHFEWVDDFAAARNHADSLLATDWECWADADDVICGAENLREVVAGAPLAHMAYVADYDYEHSVYTGACKTTLSRERLVRRHAGTWMGRVHPHKVISGGAASIRALDRSVAVWVHRKMPGEFAADEERERRIFRRWQIEDPDDPVLRGWIETGENPTRLSAQGWPPPDQLITAPAGPAASDGWPASGGAAA